MSKRTHESDSDDSAVQIIEEKVLSKKARSESDEKEHSDFDIVLVEEKKPSDNALDSAADADIEVLDEKLTREAQDRRVVRDMFAEVTRKAEQENKAKMSENAQPLDELYEPTIKVINKETVKEFLGLWAGLLYEDNIVSIAYRLQSTIEPYKKVLTLFVTNKSDNDVNDLKMSVIREGPLAKQLVIERKPSHFLCTLVPGVKHEETYMALCCRPFRLLPVLRISFDVDGDKREMNLSIPLTFLHFFFETVQKKAEFEATYSERFHISEGFDDDTVLISLREFGVKKLEESGTDDSTNHTFLISGRLCASFFYEFVARIDVDKKKMKAKVAVQTFNRYVAKIVTKIIIDILSEA